MKKMISLALVLLLVIMMSVTVFAHGGYRTAAAQPQYALCPVDSCNVAGPHQHNDAWYCSQNCWQDGHCTNYGTGHGCGRR